METISYAFHAVMPILLTIALGFVLIRVGRWDRQFFKKMNGFCYRVLLPVQLFNNVYQIEALSAVNWRVVVYTIIWVPLAIAIGILAAMLFIRDAKQKGVLVLASFRSNQAILGLPLAVALGGQAAAPIMSLVMSIGIPLFNISAVLILVAYNHIEGKRPTFGSIMKTVFTNPLTVGVLAGLAAVGIRQFIPAVDGVPVFSLQNQLPSVYKVIGSLSAVASPVMLICLGAEFDFRLTGKLLPQIGLGVFLRLVLIPGAAITMAMLMKDYLGLTVAEMPMMLAFLASPIAVSSVVLVQELGSDEQYASQLVIWSSALSMITLFLFAVILRSVGML